MNRGRLRLRANFPDSQLPMQSPPIKAASVTAAEYTSDPKNNESFRIQAT